MWESVGLIQPPWGEIRGLIHSALQPTPFQIDAERIRIFFGGRDDLGVARIFFVDVGVDSPSVPLLFSHEPVLDIGQPGHFDDNGVVPTTLVRHEKDWHLYYAGYQIPQKAKFVVFGGCAQTPDLATPFVRCTTTPVMDRRPGEELFRVPHSICKSGSELIAWYGGGNQYLELNGQTKPVYDIRRTKTVDGKFCSNGQTCLTPGPSETRLARPWVLRGPNQFEMYFGAYTTAGEFRLGFARSEDGIVWRRDDNEVTFSGKRQSWEKKSRSYPAVVETRLGHIMFYNGDSYGRDGIAVAIRRESAHRRGT